MAMCKTRSYLTFDLLLSIPFFYIKLNRGLVLVRYGRLSAVLSNEITSIDTFRCYVQYFHVNKSLTS